MPPDYVLLFRGWHELCLSTLSCEGSERVICSCGWSMRYRIRLLRLKGHGCDSGRSLGTLYEHVRDISRLRQAQSPALDADIRRKQTPREMQTKHPPIGLLRRECGCVAQLIASSCIAYQKRTDFFLSFSQCKAGTVRRKRLLHRVIN